VTSWLGTGISKRFFYDVQYNTFRFRQQENYTDLPYLDKTEKAGGLLIIKVHPYPPEQEYGKFSNVSMPEPVFLNIN
jgi:hypothetical protein